jgi:hypothetical protein
LEEAKSFFERRISKPPLNTREEMNSMLFLRGVEKADQSPRKAGTSKKSATKNTAKKIPAPKIKPVKPVYKAKYLEKLQAQISENNEVDVTQVCIKSNDLYSCYYSEIQSNSRFFFL